MSDDCAVLGFCRHFGEWCELEKCPEYECKKEYDEEEI